MKSCLVVLSLALVGLVMLGCGSKVARDDGTAPAPSSVAPSPRAHPTPPLSPRTAAKPGGNGVPSAEVTASACGPVLETAVRPLGNGQFEIHRKALDRLIDVLSADTYISLRNRVFIEDVGTIHVLLIPAEEACWLTSKDRVESIASITLDRPERGWELRKRLTRAKRFAVTTRRGAQLKRLEYVLR
jgi:hypothetical protein